KAFNTVSKRIINTTVGITVAASAVNKPFNPDKRQPIYPDNFVLIGPGNVLESASISENSSSSIHLYVVTTSRCIKGIAESPPPYPSIPARKKAIKMSLCFNQITFLYQSLPFSLAYHEYFDISNRKSTRLNSSHVSISYAVFCLKKK